MRVPDVRPGDFQSGPIETAPGREEASGERRPRGTEASADRRRHGPGSRRSRTTGGHRCGPKWVLEEGMAVAMFDLGEMWKRGEVFLPEVVASAEVFKALQRHRRTRPDGEEGPRHPGQRAGGAVHREGRPARSGEEHGGCDASHERIRRARYGQGRERRQDHRGDRRVGAADPRDERAVDHDRPVSGDRDQEAGGRGVARQGEGDGGRGSGHAGMGREDRRGRLREQRPGGG